MTARSLNIMRTLGLEHRAKTSPVTKATPTKSVMISIDATTCPWRLAVDMAP
jgi:hypothetical protein